MKLVVRKMIVNNNRLKVVTILKSFLFLYYVHKSILVTLIIIGQNCINNDAHDLQTVYSIISINILGVLSLLAPGDPGLN